MVSRFFPSFCSAKHIFVTALACVSISMKAQDLVEIPFNGIVTDIAGNPIKKVKVYNYDPKVFTFSNKEGKFGLTNVNANDTIHLVYDKRTYDIPVEGKRSMRIRLAEQLLPTVQEDEELVNLGMIFVKKREFHGSSKGLSGEELLRMGYTDIIEAIVGRVPGVVKMDGKLIIRGINSINSSIEPLYLVDGVQVSSFSYVSMYDVDHIEVIKDANMYGARGANGVIAVTTKMGKR